MRHDTSSYSNQPQKESINMINIYNDSYEDYLEDLFATNHLSGNPIFSSHTNLTLRKVINPLSESTTSSSPNRLLDEFTDELALITFLPRNDDHPFDIESDLREIEYLLNQDPTKEMDSILEDLIDECNLANPNDDLFVTIPEMFTDEHTLDYSAPPLYDDFNDDLDEFEFDNDDAYDDPFDFKEDKIKESKLLIEELDLPRSSDFIPSSEYDSFLFKDFFEVDALPSTDNEDKVFNLGILIHENLFEVTVQVTPDKNVKKISSSNASLILEDFCPPLYELPFHKEVPGSKTLLSFSSKNEEKVFKPEILTSKGVHTSLLSELSHRGSKAFKVMQITKVKPLPRNTIANPKNELKSITTQSGLVLDGPSVPMPPPFINPEEDERAMETLTDPELAEYTIKVPPPLVQKAKPLPLRNYVVHQRDPRYPHIPYPSRMNQEKHQEIDEI
nr:hypothetical protein [Tanacetum cinerariifolium]